MMSMTSEGIIEEEVMPREATLRRPEQAGEMGEKASLRRRCRYLLGGKLAVPEKRRGGDGGGIVVLLARQGLG